MAIYLFHRLQTPNGETDFTIYIIPPLPLAARVSYCIEQ